MKFNRPTTYFLFLSSLFLVYFHIFPTFPHENGADTFVYHGYARTLEQLGVAYWIISPLSYIGLYPFSQPSGIPFLLSGLTLILGIDMELVILILNFNFVTLGVLSMFLLGRSLSTNSLFIFASIFIFTNSYYFISWNSWGISPRGMFIAIIPLLIFLLLELSSVKARKRQIILIFLTYLLLLTTHRMVSQIIPFIIIPFTIGYVFLIVLGNNTLSRKFDRLKLSRLFHLTLIVLILSLFIIVTSGINIYQPIIENVPGQRYVQNYYNAFFSIIITYAIYSTPLLILAPFGVAFLLFYNHQKLHKNKIKEIQISCSFLTFIPLVLGVEYTAPVILPYIAILSGYGIVFLRIYTRRRNINLYPAFLSVIVIFGICFSSYQTYLNNRPNVDENDRPTVRDWTSSEEINTGRWLKHSINQREWVSFQDALTRNRLSANANVRTLAHWDIIKSDPDGQETYIIKQYSTINILTYKSEGGYGGTYYSRFTGSSGNNNDYLIYNHIDEYQTIQLIEYYNIKYSVWEHDIDYQGDVGDNKYRIYSDFQIQVSMV